jgi:hypothetical protein
MAATAEAEAPETQGSRRVRPYPVPLTEAMRADLHRRAGAATVEAGARVTVADVIHQALWPDGPPTS